MKVLIVDDIEVNIELLEARLEGSGYEVTSAKNGVEALEKLKKDSFDLIISDILMPGMDGFQLCRECKKDDTLKEIPFVFYTATYTDKKDEEFALSLGADRFIIKPMEHKGFMEIIEDLLKSLEEGLMTPSEMPVEQEEADFFTEYSERLVKKLEKKMLDLEREVTERKQAEKTLQKRTYDLHERNKELKCLYGISKLDEKQDISLEEMIQGIVNLIPPGWQYPEITCARVTVGDQEFRTENFRETNWKQASDIIAHGDRIGILEVFYREEKPKSDEGPFLKEERELIITITERLGHITEREQAHAELINSEARYRNLVETINEGIFIRDKDGDIIYVNNFLADLLGYSQEDLVNNPIDTFLDQKNLRIFNKQFEERRLGVSGQFELSWRKKDGITLPTLISAKPIFAEDGSFNGAIAAITDLTQRILLEAQLAQAQKLEAIGMLATGIAHEINTPTQYIYANIEFLQDAFEKLAGVANQVPRILEVMKSGASTDDLVSGYEETVKEAGLDYITEEIPGAISGSLDGVNRISEIVDSMRYFAHPGKKDKVTFDVNEALKKAVTLSRNEWKYNADNVMDLDPSLPQIQGFPAEFSQVLLNLIINAAQAITGVVGETPKVKGTITTSTFNQDDWIEVRIGDTGPGIPEEVRSKIFDPFFTTKEVGKGTGQGLAIAYSVIVEKHNGSIDFETETGKGTTFILRLPVAPDSIPD